MGNADIITIKDEVLILPEGEETICRSKLPRVEKKTIKRIQFNSDLKCIRSSSFYETQLEYVEVPQSVITLEDKAFESCLYLKEAIIPKSVRKTKLECNRTFIGCKALEKVSISGHTTAHLIFLGCDNLKEIVLLDCFPKWLAEELARLTTMPTLSLGPNSTCTIKDGAIYDNDKLMLVLHADEKGTFKLPDDVKGLDENCFRFAKDLKTLYLHKVQLPNSTPFMSLVQGCPKLQKIIVPAKDKKFETDSLGKLLIERSASVSKKKQLIYAVSKIKEAEIPEGVEEILPNVFKSCKSLVTVKCPHQVKIVGDKSFANCTKLSKVSLSDNIEVLPESVFESCVSLDDFEWPKHVTEIKARAFANCKKLPDFFFGDNLTEIGDEAFRGCTSLEKVTFNDTFRTVNPYTFEGCTSLTTVCLGSNLRFILKHAFEGCKSLTTVTFKRIGQIDEYAFANCTSLEEIEFPEGLYYIGDFCFFNCKKLRKVTFQNGLAKLLKSAFEGCTNLEEVILPDSLNMIEEHVFKGCTSIQSLRVPKNLKEKYWNAFSELTHLKQVSIPSTMKDATDVFPKDCVIEYYS